MKTPEQIYTEVGCEIHKSNAEWLSLYRRAFTVSDIAKIIDEAKLESDAYLRAAASDNADWFDALVNDCAEKLGCEHKPTAVLNAIDKLKAKGGVCEWGEHHTFKDYKTTACERDYYHSQAYKYCPGCGKEIKIV